MPSALVTGANRGIGLALVKALVAQGTSVIGACRSPSSELQATGARIEALDVTSEASCADLGRRLDGQRLDLLVHNAGILRGESIDSLDPDGMLQQLAVNSVGPLRLTRHLLPHLADRTKIVIVTSRMGSIADNDSGGAYGYRMSKAAVNAAGRSLAIDLAPRGIAVGLVHPGWVRTDMTGGRGHVTAEQSAAGIVDRIGGLTRATSGTFWHAITGEELPW